MLAFVKYIKKLLYTILYTVYWILYLLLRTDCRNHIPNIKGAEKLVILANGPSLKEEIANIDFKGKDISVLNDFYKSPWYKTLKPNYYVLADPMFFLNEDFFMSFIKDINWDMYLYVPYYYWNKMDILKKMNHSYIKVIPYHSENYNGFMCLKNLLYKEGLSMPKVQNVLVASIFTGLNMGYKYIYLYGVDHSWTKTLGVNNNNEVCAVDSHFYDTDKPSFSPYWKNPATREQYKMHELLRDFAYMFESYHELRCYADSLGSKIVNMTKNSFIDAFERA